MSRKPKDDIIRHTKAGNAPALSACPFCGSAGEIRLIENPRSVEGTVPENERRPDLYEQQTFSNRDIDRTDPHLIQVVKELGEKANGPHAQLAIANVEKGTKYRIDEYDGSESVMTIDDYDWSIA